jgi:tetratricopeptide (TPR) repeat protein
MASYFGSAFVVFSALLVYTASARQQVAVARAEAELASAIEQKESLAILISELETRLSTSATDASPELAREIVALRTELEKARGDIGKKSVALADAERRPQTSSPARPLVDRGNRFFSDGNMAGARAEYEKAREIDPSLAEPNLKLGIVYEFQDRPIDARSAYLRYLDLRRDAPDRVEIEGRLERLNRQLSSPVPALAAAALPAPASTAAPVSSAGPAKTPSPEDLMAARAKQLLEEGHTQLKAKNTGEAVKAYRAVVKEFGGYADGHYWLATALAFEGEDGPACKEFKRYLDIAPAGSLAESARRNVAECN